MSKKILFTNHEFNYLGFLVSIYPSGKPQELTVLIADSLHGVNALPYQAIEITEDVIQFAMSKVQEQVSNDEMRFFEDG